MGSTGGDFGDIISANKISCGSPCGLCKKNYLFLSLEKKKLSLEIWKKKKKLYMKKHVGDLNRSNHAYFKLLLNM